jgi:hypothetical protein
LAVPAVASNDGNPTVTAEEEALEGE